MIPGVRAPVGEKQLCFYLLQLDLPEDGALRYGAEAGRECPTSGCILLLMASVS